MLRGHLSRFCVHIGRAIKFQVLIDVSFKESFRRTKQVCIYFPTFRMTFSLLSLNNFMNWSYCDKDKKQSGIFENIADLSLSWNVHTSSICNSSSMSVLLQNLHILSLIGVIGLVCRPVSIDSWWELDLNLEMEFWYLLLIFI